MNILEYLSHDFPETTDSHRASQLPARLSFSVFDNHEEKNVSTPANNKDFIYRGYSGHGIQSWRWRTIYQTSQCGIAIDIPVNGVFSDSDKNGDPRIAAELLVNACLSAVTSGVYFQKQKLSLYIVMETDDLEFRLLDEKTNDLVYEGTELEELLDILEGCHKKQLVGYITC